MKPYLEVAKSQIGVEETPRGSNWGEEIKQYLHSVEIDFPASWCMAFVFWCVEKSVYRLNDITGGKSNPLVRTGSVMRQWNEIEAHTQSLFPLDMKFKFSTPEVGDIFIIDHGHGLGHTGFVNQVEGDLIRTIEGNTNDTGAREGYEVCERVRNIKDIKGFIRI